MGYELYTNPQPHQEGWGLERRPVKGHRFIYYCVLFLLLPLPFYLKKAILYFCDEKITCEKEYVNSTSYRHFTLLPDLELTLELFKLDSDEV